MSNEIEETAKAAQEIAKASGKAIDTLRETGPFIKGLFRKISG